jgi:hypothetical protein
LAIEDETSKVLASWLALIFLSSVNNTSIVFCMDGEDVCKLFASDFGTVKVFAGERMINMFLSMMSDGVVSVSFCLSFF